MPTQSVRDDYAEWLATPPATGILVETLELHGAALKTPIAICNRKDSPLVATGEDGVPRTYHPLAFEISRPQVRNSTEMLVTARVDGVDGTLFRALSEVAPSSFDHSLHATLRVFIDPVMLDRPCWNAPLRFRVETAKIAVDVVELQLVGGRLPTKRAGTYYDLARFVGLRPY